MISSSKFINITILIIIVGLASIALLKPKFVPSHQTEVLTALDVSSIHSIIINKPDQVIDLSKHNDDWFVLVNNININANKKLVSQLLTLSQQTALSIERDSDEELDKYGLSESNFSITFNNTIIKLGNSEPFANRHYGFTNNKVYIIDDNHYRKILKPITDYVSKSLVQSGDTVTNLKILWKRKPPIQLPTMKSKNLYQNWQNVDAENIEIYEGQQAIAIALVQINLGDILEFSIIPSKNTLKLARKDLGIIYVIPKQFMASLLTFTPPRHN